MEDQIQKHPTGQAHAKTRDMNALATNKTTSTIKVADYSARTRVRNRRLTYLYRHPSYFMSHELELADPLLYDRCVRRFQSAAEREAEGHSKGYSGILEADLYRSEARIAALKNQARILDQPAILSAHVTHVLGPGDEVLPEDPNDIPQNKQEGIERWKDEMTMRFLNGKDRDFPYNEVDENDEWDTFENREAEDRWFDDEKPEWTISEHAREGETGIQDF